MSSVLELNDIVQCEHDYKLCRDNLGGISFLVCYKCGWTEKAIKTAESIIIELKQNVSLLDLYDKVKEEKEK